MSEKLVSQRQELRGVGVSSGIGFGHARVMQTSSLQVPRYSVTAEDVDKEIGRLKKAVGSVSRELDQMIRRSPKKAPKEVKTFLEVFKLLVNDSTMFEDVSDRIESQLINVEWALQKHLEDTLKLFDNLTDAYLAERSDDIVHVIRRLQEELTGERRKIQEKVRNAQSEVILVTNDLSIADVIWLTEYEELDLVGIVTEKGGPTSHTLCCRKHFLFLQSWEWPGQFPLLKIMTAFLWTPTAVRSSAIRRLLKLKRLNGTSKLRKRSIPSCIVPADVQQKRKTSSE